MNFFYNDSRSEYEEVKSYYPVWYPQIKEMNANFYLSGSFLDRMALDMERTANNHFVMEMEETIIDRLLSYFGVETDPESSLEEKRSVLAALYDGNGKVSASQIMGWVKIFHGPSIKSEIIFTNQLKVSIYLQEIEDLVRRDMYEFLKERIPAHLALSLYGRYLTKHEVSICYEHAVRFHTAFYPRYNLPYLQLDRTWKLEDGRQLSGYDSRDVLDFYPIQFRIKSEVALEIRTEERLRIAGSVANGIKIAAAFHLKTEAVEDIRTEEQVGVRAEAAYEIRTASCMTKINQLDREWSLSGSRKLNGGRYIL